MCLSEPCVHQCQAAEENKIPTGGHLILFSLCSANSDPHYADTEAMDSTKVAFHYFVCAVN